MNKDLLLLPPRGECVDQRQTFGPKDRLHCHLLANLSRNFEIISVSQQRFDTVTETDQCSPPCGEPPGYPTVYTFLRVHHRISLKMCILNSRRMLGGDVDENPGPGRNQRRRSGYALDPRVLPPMESAGSVK